MLIRVKRKLRHPDAPQRHDNHRRPMTRRELIAQGFLTGGATVLSTGVVQPVREPARGVRAARERLAGRLRTCSAAASIAAARKIPFICFDLAGGANLAGSNVLVGKAARSASSTCCRRPATASSACRATRSRASRRRPRARRARATAITPTRAWGSRSTATARFCAACTRASRRGGDRRKHQRRRDSGALRERHEQQSAQPALRPPARRRGGLDPHACRLAELGLGRQLDGAADDDQSEVPADEGRPAERRRRASSARAIGRSGWPTQDEVAVHGVDLSDQQAEDGQQRHDRAELPDPIRRR